MNEADLPYVYNPYPFCLPYAPILCTMDTDIQCSKTRYHAMRFWILITIVAISGLSQGMLLPLLSMLLEKQGFPLLLTACTRRRCTLAFY